MGRIHLTQPRMDVAAVTGLQMSYLYMLVYTMCCVEANITIITHHPPALQYWHILLALLNPPDARFCFVSRRLKRKV